MAQQIKPLRHHAPYQRDRLISLNSCYFTLTNLKGRDTEIAHPLVHSQVAATARRINILVSHTRGRGQALEPSSVAFPGALSGHRIQNRTSETQTGTKLQDAFASSSWSLYATMLTSPNAGSSTIPLYFWSNLLLMKSWVTDDGPNSQDPDNHTEESDKVPVSWLL